MYRARALLHTVATSYHNILDNVEAVSVDNSYLTLAYLSEEVDNRERQRAMMHLQNQGLSDAQLDKLLSSCRRLREVLSKKTVVVGSAVRAEFYRSPAVSL